MAFQLKLNVFNGEESLMAIGVYTYMNIKKLTNAAIAIAQKNVTETTVAITVSWHEQTKKLTVIYYLACTRSDEDRELCELTFTELIAEFPEVKLGDTQCLYTQDNTSVLKTLNNLVYLRDSNFFHN